ncbi:MAG: hypothetical protein WEA61_06805 [Anaerolineales bacterium]
MQAPGRLTSSPWPECIQIISIERLASEQYRVSAVIVEAPSADAQFDNLLPG